MTVVHDYRPKSNALDSRLTLRFGRRTGPGGGTDQARFAQQCVLSDDPVFGHHYRFESGPADTAQWAAANATTPDVVLVGATTRIASPGDTLWFHMVHDFTDMLSKGQPWDLFWELHNSGNTVNSTIAPNGWLLYGPSNPWETVSGGRIVPNTNQTPGLTHRIATGVVPSGGGNQSFWHPNIAVPGFQPCPPGPIHILWGVHFSPDADGWEKAKVWRHSDPVPAQYTFELADLPTMLKTSNGVVDSPYCQFGKYGYPEQVGSLLSMGWAAATSEEEALGLFPLTGTAPPSGDSLPLTKTGSPPRVKVSWTPVPGAGYVFFLNGKRVANTWDATLDHTYFGSAQNPVKTGDVIEVKAVEWGVHGTVTV